MLEKKVYEGYAFKPDMYEKRDINREIYKELTEKYTVFCGDTEHCPNTDAYDIVIHRIPRYYHSVYRILRNRPKLAPSELALLCDLGSLCFGYKLENNGDIRVFED